MRRLFLPVVIVLAMLLPPASHAARVDPLYQALGLPEVIAIMRQEGITYGVELQAELFQGRGGAQWAALVDQIYDLDRMQRTVVGRLESELQSDDLDAMIGFFETERGRRIVSLEVSARRALLDKSVDEASRVTLDDMILDNDPRLDLIREFADANELVDSNVVGAMNSNYAFYTGLALGGVFPDTLSEEEILADVWSQEPEIRDDTEQWLYSYLVLAYQPLDDADLRAYINFSRTDPGQKLNRAMFVAFDEMFVAVSLALGRGAARFIIGEEL